MTILKIRLILDHCHKLYFFLNFLIDFLTSFGSKGLFNSTFKLSIFVLSVTSPSSLLLSLVLGSLHPRIHSVLRKSAKDG